MRPRTIRFDPSTVRRFEADQRYLVAISGGRDSVVLLHWLVSCGFRKLIVCHLNHRLRGRAAYTDANFVRHLAEQHALQFETDAIDVRKNAAADKQSLETAAREARYRFFASVARRRRCRTIFLGHHADDVVETFLLNLFRGAGMTGLASIRPVRTRRVDRVELKVVRPLLGIWREEIDRYVREHQLRFREDATNTGLEATRNRVRHVVVPFLEQTFGRKVRRNIWRTAAIAAEEENFFGTLLANTAPDALALAVQPLREIPIAVQRRLLRQWLRGAQVADVGFDLVERVRALLDPIGRIAKTNLTGGRHVRRRSGELFIE